MADTARRGVAQKQHGRLGSRIVPAIPYRLYRAQPSARPITPEESNKGTVTQQSEPQPEPHTVTEKQPDSRPEEEAHQVDTADTPPTPDSQPSDAEKRETDEPVITNVSFKSQEEEDTATGDARGGYSQNTPP